MEFKINTVNFLVIYRIEIFISISNVISVTFDNLNCTKCMNLYMVV